ncbi:MAG: FAD:protein FMN transferase [Sandaracinaceae bacterium]|jgi:thiamine biosynthesis lipoprotein|nr:FAD:protein FMN transferase [Sandaracinaceae bacterium]
MKQHAFLAMGTDWTILADGCGPEALVQAERLVRDVEGRLSRFLPDSAVSRLNRDREASDPVLAAVLHEAMGFLRDTGGAFDPRLGAQLASLGYDRPFAEVRSPAGSPRLDEVQELQVMIEGAHVSLEGNGSVDLGGIAKGWTVDRVLDALVAAGAGAVLVDGGGDIAVRGAEWPIGVDDDLSVLLRDGAVATSSTRGRRWQSAQGQHAHHILSARTGLPATSPVDTVTVVAPNATTADALATAALVDPSGQLPRLTGPGYQAAMRASSGAWYTTPNWSEAP